jgi:uncharacterized protein (TIGR02147 family)
VTKNRPDLCEAKNHHSYLKELFDYTKKKNPVFSHAFCAKKIGVSSSYLKNVFSGRRHLNIEWVAKIAAIFRLTAFERRLLTVMLVRDQITEKDTRTYFDGVIGVLKAEKIQLKNNPIFKKSPESDKTINNALSNLLHSVAQLTEFRPDPLWVKSCLSDSEITPEQITSGFQELLERGQIEKRDGKYFVQPVHGSSPDPYNLDTFKVYREGLKIVDHALENILDYKTCGFMMSQLVVNREDADRILEAFNRFREEAMEIERNSKNPDRVIGVSNNYLTLARVEKK